MARGRGILQEKRGLNFQIQRAAITAEGRRMARGRSVALVPMVVEQTPAVGGAEPHPRPPYPCGAGSSQRNRNRSFHSGSVGTEAHGATPIAQRGEVVASKMPHLLAAV